MTSPTFTLQITSTPPGEAPEWVRQAWVGLSLPLVYQSSGARSFYTWGVLTAPRGFLGNLFAFLFRLPRKQTGYLVGSQIAVKILEAGRPDAAAWWRENTPYLLKPSGLFVFNEVCGHIVRR